MAKISNGTLFLAQTADVNNAITALELKEYTSPVATQPNNSIKKKGVPGLVFPSEQFQFNEDTGELSLRGDDNAIKELIGYIGYEQNLAPGTDLEGLPVTLTPSQSGTETANQYYSVIDPEYKYLTNDWGTGYYDPNAPASDNIQRVYVGDEVIKQANGDWVVRQNYVSSLYMLKKLDAYPHMDQVPETPAAE